VDATSDIMDTVRDLSVEAALRLARGEKARWAFLIDQAAELLAERSQLIGVRTVNRSRCARDSNDGT
jgi:hypothetical protein